MTKKIVVFVHLILLVGLLGCKKKVMDVNKDFEGLWYSESKYMEKYTDNYKTIEIDENSSGEYNDSEGFANKGYKGKARIKGNLLKIGIKKFTIDEAPVRLGNVGDFWRMKISGVTYYIDREYQYGGGAICEPSKLQIWNVGNSTIHAKMDGVNRTILPNGIIESAITCFGCESKYTDDHGNNFSFFHTGCANTVQIQ